MKHYEAIEMMILPIAEEDIVRTSVQLGDGEGFGDEMEY